MLPNSIHNQDLGKESQKKSPTEQCLGDNASKTSGTHDTHSKDDTALNNRPSGNVSDVLEVMFQRLELSHDQKQLASRYYTLSMQLELSEQDTTFLIHVWEKAHLDAVLEKALSFVDGLKPPALETQTLISQNKDMRTYLSEHIVVLAESKLQERRGNRNNLGANQTYVTMVCPDGSGIVNKQIDRDSYLRLDKSELYEGVCDRCHAKLSDHVKFIGANNIGGARDGPLNTTSVHTNRKNREDRETMRG